MAIIKNRLTGKVMFRSSKKTIKELLEFKVRQNANLRNADLSDADLRNANLSDADLSDANLSDANLSVEKPSIESHQFISEVLHRKAKTESQLDFSARIRIQTGCKYNWKFFIALAKKKRVLKWACKILFQWDEFREKFKKEVK